MSTEAVDESAIDTPARGAGLRIENLTISYGPTSVLRDVTLPIRERAITAIVGPSGCGKSSLLLCLNRLIDLVPQASVSGRVTWGDVDVLSAGTDVVTLRRQVAYIQQKPTTFPLSIARNLELPLLELPELSRSDRVLRAEQALRDVDLWDEVRQRLQAPAQTLSGGQQQRLCLARALVLRPSVLLLDEPCSSLDPLATGVIEQLLVKLKASLTIVLVTHQLAQARRVADEVAVLYREGDAGRLVEQGPASHVFANPQHPLTAAYVRGPTIG